MRDMGAAGHGDVSRRGFLKRSGWIAVSAAVGGGLLGSGADAGASSPDLTGSKKLLDVVSSTFAEVLEGYRLPLTAGSEGAVFSIDLTEPRAGLAIDARLDGASLIGRADASPTSGVLLPARTLHYLLSGQITPAFAIASGSLLTVGRRAELAGLHQLPSVARPIYLRKLDSLGESELGFPEAEVLA